MSRGRLVSPNLDDRTWQEIVEQARALIPKYAPKWTDHSPSDPGIALLELFAWFTEGLSFQLNRIPERHFLEFLNLVGLTRTPATPASTHLTFGLNAGSPSVTVVKGSQASTQQDGTDEAVVFETDEDVHVIPIDLTTALLYQKTDVGAYEFFDISPALIAAPLTGLPIFVHRLQETVIYLGFDAKTTEEIALKFKLLSPVAGDGAVLAWRFSQSGTVSPDEWLDPPSSLSDGTNSLQNDGTVRLTIGTDWDKQKIEDWRDSDYWQDPASDILTEELYWIGLKIQAPVDPLDFELAHILINSVSATTALTVEDESVGVSDGKPFQYFQLCHHPVFSLPGKIDPYEHFELEIREPTGINGEFGTWSRWTRVTEFLSGNQNHYRLDPATGTIYFGNYDDIAGHEEPAAHGRIPPLDSELRAVSYRYVATGAQGNLPPNTITDTCDSEVQSVTNLGPAVGGSDGESIEEMKRRAPEVLRQRYRAITVEDFEYLAREASPDVKKVRCLPPRLFTEGEITMAGESLDVNEGDPWTFRGVNRSTNCVNIIIVPDASSTESRPRPSVELLQTVADYLDERRALTTLHHVTGPYYLPIDIRVNVMLWPEAVDSGRVSTTTVEESILSNVEESILSEIVEFLHPLTGGAEGRGWEIGQGFPISGLLAHIHLPSEVGYIASIEPYVRRVVGPSPPGMESDDAYVPVADYELVCSGSHNVTVEVFGRS